MKFTDTKIIIIPLRKQKEITTDPLLDTFYKQVSFWSRLGSSLVIYPIQQETDIMVVCHKSFTATGNSHQGQVHSEVTFISIRKISITVSYNFISYCFYFWIEADFSLLVIVYVSEKGIVSESNACLFSTRKSQDWYIQSFLFIFFQMTLYKTLLNTGTMSCAQRYIIN